MLIREFQPHPALAPYVDAYWEATCPAGDMPWGKILPDGCVDLVVNLGNDFSIEDSGARLQHEKAYIGGALTRFLASAIPQDLHLAGLRLKPGAFSAFYPGLSLHEVTDTFAQVHHSFMPRYDQLLQDIPGAFDAFLGRRACQPEPAVAAAVALIGEHKGNISVARMAAMLYTTERQLERSFRRHIGLSPRSLAGIIQYRSALQMIRSGYPAKNLLDIALDCGYYDHAHLSKAIRKYTGTTPSLL